MKKNIRYMGYLLAAPAVALLLGACSEMDDVFGNSSSKEIKFKAVEASDWNQTRAAEQATAPQYSVEKLETPDGSPLYLHTCVQQGIESQQPAQAATRGTATTTENIGDQELGIFAYRHDKSEAWGTQLPNLMWNKSAVKDETDNLYHLTSNRYWPSTDEYVTFAAYAPRNGKGIAVSDDEYAGKPYIDFTVQTAANAQIDLVTAVATNQTPAVSTDNGVELQFKHALTAVKFIVGDDLFTYTHKRSNYGSIPMIIKSITFRNIVTTARYVIGQGWDENNMGEANQSVRTSGISLSSENLEAGDNITTEEQTFYMIPQEFTDDNQVLELTVEWNGQEYILEKSLNGVESWNEGQTVVYKLSSTEVNKLTAVNLTLNMKSNSGLLYGTGILKSSQSLNTEGKEAGLYILSSTTDYKYESSKYYYKTSGKVEKANIKLTCGSDGKFHLPEDFEFDITGKSYDYYIYYPYKELAEMPKEGDNFETDWETSSSATIWLCDALGKIWPISNGTTDEDILASTFYGYQAEISDMNALTGNLDLTDHLAYATYSNFYNNNDRIIRNTNYSGTKYYLKGDANRVWYENCTAEVFTPSETFAADCQPIRTTSSGSSTTYWWILRPGVENTITAVGDYDGWSWTYTPKMQEQSSGSEIRSTLSIKSNANKSLDDGETATEYELQVGDIYYTDGGFSHKNDDLRTGAVPCGVVAYINDGSDTGNLVTENGVESNSGHALVILKNYERYSWRTWISHSSGYQTQGFYGIEEDNNPFINASTFELAKSDYKGYEKTAYVWSKIPNERSNGQTAFGMTYFNNGTYKFGEAYTNPYYNETNGIYGSSKVFLPSVGQWIAALAGLNEVSLEQVTQQNNSNTNIKTLLVKAGSNSSNTTSSVFTSSEYSTNNAWVFNLNEGSFSNYTKAGTSNQYVYAWYFFVF